MSERNLSEHATQFSIGQLIGEDAQRDAIHIAVAPVRAAEKLYPGQAIAVGIDLELAVASTTAAIGIVDPFLPGPVFQGQRFWMFLLPNTITGLRHQWTHPGFDVVSTISQAAHEVKSRKWLEDAAARMDITYDFLLACAQRRLQDYEHTVQHGSENWRDDFPDPKEFWHHYQIVTGESVADTDQTVFCCTC